MLLAAENQDETLGLSTIVLLPVFCLLVMVKGRTSYNAKCCLPPTRAYPLSTMSFCGVLSSITYIFPICDRNFREIKPLIGFIPYHLAHRSISVTSPLLITARKHSKFRRTPKLDCHLKSLP